MPSQNYLPADVLGENCLSMSHSKAQMITEY